MTTTVPMIPTTINERWTLLLPEHRAVRQEWPVWERERIGHMWRNVRPGDAVFDVGSEEGDLPALWAKWAGPAGGVVLVEPNPAVWPNIRAIWEANDLHPPLLRWVGFAGPVDDHRRPRWPHNADLTDWPDCARGPLIGNHGFLNLCERPDVPVARLDTLAAWAGRDPDVVTIDVEGAELEVLRGAERILATSRPLVYASVHPDFMRQMYGQAPADLDAFMEGFGYARTELAHDHEQHILYSHPHGRPVLDP
jgi:FkbM family methyltransferase